MNDTSRYRGRSSTRSVFLIFARGAAVGAGLALLLAADSGEGTRRSLAATARHWSEGAGHAIDQARESVTDLGSDAKSALKAGHDAFRYDRAKRESHFDRRAPRAGDAVAGSNAANRSGEGAVR